MLNTDGLDTFLEGVDKKSPFTNLLHFAIKGAGRAVQTVEQRLKNTVKNVDTIKSEPIKAAINAINNHKMPGGGVGTNLLVDLIVLHEFMMINNTGYPEAYFDLVEQEIKNIVEGKTRDRKPTVEPTPYQARERGES